MNEIIQSLYNRKSVRVFEERDISPDSKAQILAAAVQAPTAGCQQLYTILDITDSAIRKSLAVLCDNQPFIAKAPMVLIFLADCRRWLDSYRFAGVEARAPGVGDLMLAVSDAVIAAHNSVVAAESLGIGSCYIGDICEQEEEVRRLLTLDEYVIPAAMLVYGYPTPSQLSRTKPNRLDMDYIVFQNQYQRLPENAHREMYTKRGDIHDAITYESFITAFCNRKYMSGFAAEMTRSVKKYLEKFM